MPKFVNSAISTTATDIKDLKNSAVNEIAGYAGDMRAETYMPEEVISVKQTEAPKKTDEFSTQGGNKTLDRILVPNQLHKFATVNQIFTLAALDLQEVNFPHILRKQSPKYPVAQSGGKGSAPEASIFSNIGLNLEFFIDNVEVHAIVAPTKKTKQNQATKITFDVIEPYSLGVFFQTLKIQAGKANGDVDFNHLNACYGLIIDFVGTDDEGNLQTVTGSRRVIPIGIQSANITANAGGATYMIEAYPWQEIAFQDINNTVFDDISLSGSTVHEMLQTGEKSLMAQLNKKIGVKAEVVKSTGAYAPYKDDTVIFFPNVLDDYDLSNDTLEAIKRDRATVADAIDTGDSQSYVSSFAVEKRDNVIEKLLLSGKNNVQVYNQYGFQGGTGIRATQQEAQTWLGNQIGSSKMFISEDDIQTLGQTFPEFNKTYDSKKKIFARNKFSLDLKNKTLKFKKGTAITDIIETVILLSEYSVRIGKRSLQLKEKTPGEVPWFRIHSQVFQLKDSWVKSITKKHPVVNVYHIIPYMVQESLFLDPSEYVPDLDFLESQTVKKYDYIYTGSNQDILDFSIDYKFGFYKAMSTNLNRDATASETSYKSKEAPNYSYRSSNTSLNVNDGSPSIRGQDLVNVRAEGTEAESTELKIARLYNDLIINSESDLFDVTMTIVGDTYFLPNSAPGNYATSAQVYDSRTTVDSEGNQYKIASIFQNSNGDANFLGRMVLVELNFLTPVDLDQARGDMTFAGYKNEKGEAIRLGMFSGLFRVVQVNSVFRQGKFTQEIRIVRPASLNTDAKSGTKSEKKTIGQYIDGTAYSDAQELGLE